MEERNRVLVLDDKPSQSRPNTLPKSRRLLSFGIAAAGAVALLAGVFAVVSAIRDQPTRIMRGAIGALEQGDVDALMELTSRDEIRHLGLTRGKIKALLDEGVWKSGLPQLERIQAVGPAPRDRWMWKVWWKGSPKSSAPAGIQVVDSLDEGPRLVLTGTIYANYIRGSRGDVKAAKNAYRRKSREVGINSYRNFRGDYAPLKPPENLADNSGVSAIR